MENQPIKPTVVPLFQDNYRAVIKNSVGTKMFQEWFCLVNGERQDVVRKGNFSCALYVTSVLKMFDLVNEIQITVHRAIAELERCGWTRAEEPREGAIVIWEAKPSEDQSWGKLVKHIGFCIGEDMAISNNDKEGKPMMHPLHKQPVIAYYWHTKLDQ